MPALARFFKWRNWPRKRRLAVFVLLGLLGVSVGIHIYFRFHVEGVYYDPYMACACNWIFKDGQVYMETEEGRKHIGTYKRSGFKWIGRGLGSSEDSVYLQSSLLGVRWIDQQFPGNGHFLPRRCFSWYVDIKDWFQNHLHIKI